MPGLCDLRRLSRVTRGSEATCHAPPDSAPLKGNNKDWSRERALVFGYKTHLGSPPRLSPPTKPAYHRPAQPSVNPRAHNLRRRPPRIRKKAKREMCRQISSVPISFTFLVPVLLTLSSATELFSKAASTTCRPTSRPLPTASPRSADSPHSTPPAAGSLAATGYVLTVSRPFDATGALTPHSTHRFTAPTSSAPPPSPRASAPNASVGSSTKEYKKPQ